MMTKNDLFVGQIIEDPWVDTYFEIRAIEGDEVILDCFEMDKDGNICQHVKTSRTVSQLLGMINFK